MKISGFTMVRNAQKYYFPIKESILSILPIVDEFIVALGDSDDGTEELIRSIDSDKIKIYPRVWSEQDFIDGRILAKETNFALSKCTGDWCFYVQADEAVHEQDWERILQACEKYIGTPQIDGFLFKYYHFFADYEHYLPFHGWYRNEIRIIRNNASIYSIKDAQSFRKNENKKLNVKEIDAHIYHYGWVRPPELMQSKKKEHDSMHRGAQQIAQEYKSRPTEFEYGALGAIPIFDGTHPAVMNDFIKNIHWKNKLNYSKKANLGRKKMKHERWKYRFLSKIENIFNGGREIMGYSNWHRI